MSAPRPGPGGDFVAMNFGVWRIDSLLSRRNSLIIEIFSLLICLGNCWGKRCSAAVSCSGIGSRSPEIAKFPVKFPVSREFGWRQVRSALRPQGGSPVRTRIFPFPILPMRTISWGPVARANLPKMDGPPGASEACPACVENRSLRPTAFGGAKRTFDEAVRSERCREC
jgi:hypothetical protein